MKRENYKASVMGVLFDTKYKFEDILLLGISNSPQESFAIQQKEIMRLYEDFGDEHGKGPLLYSEGRSEYDEPIIIIKYPEGYEHIYCLFDEEET